MIIAGNKIYDKCLDCGKLVQINKFLFGSLHVCLSEEEKRVSQQQRYQIKQQEDYCRFNNHNNLDHKGIIWGKNTKPVKELQNILDHKETE